MTEADERMTPEHVFLKVAWRSTLESGQALERYTTWSIGGVAVIVALLVSNLDSVSRIASIGGVKWSILLFAASLVAGAASKQCGMAVAAGVNTVTKTEDLLNSESGQDLMSKMTIEPKALVDQLSQPFIWPLSALIRKSGEKGLVDFVAADKRLVRMFSLQVGFNVAHGLLAALALVVIGLSIS